MDLSDILKLLQERIKQKATTVSTGSRDVSLKKLLDYAGGDMWGKGDYWRGRVPQDNDLTKIEKLFTADDQIRPALSRYVASIVGKDFEWDTQTTELVDPLTAWHYDARLQQAMQRALYLMFATGKSVLRLYIPDEYRDELNSAKTLEAALELLHLQVLDTRHAGAITDEHGREVAYFYRYTIKEEGQDAKEFVELHTPRIIYRYRLSGDTLTPEQEADESGQNISYERENPLFDVRRKRRPRYLMFELNRDEPMLTPSILDKQDGLNVTWTNMRRNDDLSGFRSIVTMNADDPVEELDDGTERAVNWTFGPDLVISLKGIPKGEDAEGNEIGGHETPSFEVIDPVDPKYFLESVDAWREGIAADFNQGFVYQSFHATSGESKREDRAAFDRTVVLESSHAIQAARWLLESVATYAGVVVGKDYKAVEFSPTFYVEVERGNLENFIALIPAYEKNLVSLDTLLTFSPAEDRERESEELDKRAKELTPPPPPEPTDPEAQTEEER